MYSVVLMMAMTAPADDMAFGRRKGNACTGCTGNCAGVVVATPVYHGCHGAGNCAGNCAGSCTGDSGRGGFLGIRARLFGRRNGGGNSCAGCHGGCAGYVANCCPTNCCAPVCHSPCYSCGHNAGCGCCGVTAPACCGTHAFATVGGCGCVGGGYAAPYHVAPAPTAPAAAPMGGAAPPAKMPEPPPVAK